MTFRKFDSLCGRIVLARSDYLCSELLITLILAKVVIIQSSITPSSRSVAMNFVFTNFYAPLAKAKISAVVAVWSQAEAII
ncbi:hypothetical protein M514_02880 [Trichuris suis]|uniref:Uncharacterized protein n=1 Tax=Trichuris suis TaxID=68888 RepID=A0A085MFV6_9BILA|nr:hypothetical protein M513_02880 [Trichuris suis]KFD66629.1 hypothetical protein M514_02880 [Trichuris suis]